MVWRTIVLIGTLLISQAYLFAQEELGGFEVQEYIRSSKLRCDDYMLTVKTEFRSEPGAQASCAGTEEFVELVSKDDGLVWRRARREAQPYEAQDEGYLCLAFPRQWCRLDSGKDIYGMSADLNNSNKDPFKFGPAKSVDPECLVFPELFEWPFLRPSYRGKGIIISTTKLFVDKLKCIDAKQEGGVVVSKWSYMNGSRILWELESEGGYPSIVKIIEYSNPVMGTVPDDKPIEYVTLNKIEWQEDDHGKYPKRVSSTHTIGDTVFVLDAEFRLNSNDNAFRSELAKVKQRLQELQNR